MPALRPVVLLTQLSPLCMTRHILDLAKSRKELRRRRLVGFETTLTSPKALGWVHPRLHFTLSAAVAPQLHSEGDKTCVHMSAGRKQSCFQGISVTPKLPKIALHCLSLAGRAVLLLLHVHESQPTLLYLNV